MSDGAERSAFGHPPAIRLEGVAVHYRLVQNRPVSLKEYFIRRVRGDLNVNYVKALDDVGLEVLRGEVFGIIGRNGAGKTTLLKVVSGIVRPIRGRLRVWGQVVSLLGVGAGFHEELTGRENVFLYSAILGRSKKRTERLFEEIVSFAELGDFIDAPLRVYSSGMRGRLGFAVAMAEPPDILLVDEVLAVGDEEFQAKCLRKFEEFQKAGTTTVIVSHSMGAIERICGRAAWLNEGRVEALGVPKDVVARFRQHQTATAGSVTIRAGSG